MQKIIVLILLLASASLNSAYYYPTTTANATTTLYPTLSVKLTVYNVTLNQGQQEQTKFTITGGDIYTPYSYTIAVTNATTHAYVIGTNIISNSSTIFYNFTMPYTASTHGELWITATIRDSNNRIGQAQTAIAIIGTQWNTTTITGTIPTTSQTTMPYTSTIGYTTNPTTSTTTIQYGTQPNLFQQIWNAIISFFKSL